jgi:hypothetical protein
MIPVFFDWDSAITQDEVAVGLLDTAADWANSHGEEVHDCIWSIEHRPNDDARKAITLKITLPNGDSEMFSCA